MKGMILAAGFGTRFRPVTWSLPKPMIPVCNRPLIGWAAEAMIDSGVDQIVVNLHHLPEPIENWLGRFVRDRASLHFSYEAEILGTGGGVRKVRSILESDPSFVLMNGDTIQFPPFDRLVESLQNRDALAALLLRQPPPGETFTSVWYQDGLVNRFGSGGSGTPLMFAGAHAMSRSIFDRLPERDFSGLTEDVYMPSVASGKLELAGVVGDGLWFDVGTPGRYMAATAGLLEAIAREQVDAPRDSVLRNGSLIHEGSRTSGTVTGSVIGMNSSIESSARIERSVIWADCRIGEGCHVSDSVMADGIDLPAGTRVMNAIVARGSDEAEDQAHTTEIGEWLVRPVDESRPWRFE